ncbi:MAG TPA: glycosyltransferase family 39 protein, partial [Bacteroidota bacterium]|nr:glycosyltransferase family 39 protein [Bacteroidota bacterium]
MRDPVTFRTALTSDTALIFYVALARLALHLWTNAFAGYGYFRDELYYLACAEHLDAGYVDQPPLSIFVLSAVRLIIGDSPFALRLTPALLSAAVVFLAGLMARQLGGGRSAQVLAAIGTAVSPISLAFGTIYSMNALDVFFWTLAAYVSMLLVRTENQRYWLLLGLVIGLGALNKISMFWFAAGFGVGILLSPHRHWLRTRWPYLAAGIALLCFLPYVIWNVIHGFPHIDFISNATGGNYSGLSQLTFLRDQLLIHNPAAIPLWAAGLGALLILRGVSTYRYLGVAVLVVTGILLLNGQSKSEYLAAAFPPLCAAGGVMIEQWTARR